jgi:hypothetical protein
LAIGRHVATMGLKVLLIYADLRNASLHKNLKLDNIIGLTNYLTGVCTPPENAGLSIRESYAVYWLLQRSQRAQDTPAVLRYADTLLRTRGRSVPLVVPVLAQMAETKDSTTAVTQLLKDNPPWRPAF